MMKESERRHYTPCIQRLLLYQVICTGIRITLILSINSTGRNGRLTWQNSIMLQSVRFQVRSSSLDFMYTLHSMKERQMYINH